MRKVIMTLAIALMGVAAQAKDIKTVIFTTQPQMHCASCEKKIKGNLRYEKGVKRIDTSVEQQKVTVKYDADKTSAEKLQKAFKKFGYEARQVKANEKVEREASQGCSNM
ncbi:heavy metal-associated domain-containing protein [Hallella sp.]|uniref:heavy-metal-associated domain-containing protein n=1 Tax=Hallella sp. TaxID=2980186 RepID=UPI00307A9683